MKQLLLGVVAGLAVGATGAPAQREDPEKVVNRKSRAAALVTTVQPGATITWKSRRIGAVRSLSLVANGAAMDYALAPKTNACVGYAYGDGVAVRVTDCEAGRRVPYVQIRAANAGIKPAHLRLRFWGIHRKEAAHTTLADAVVDLGPMWSRGSAPGKNPKRPRPHTMRT
jgi:hypothetical protein